MGDAVQAAETIQRIDETGDEADPIVAPASVVDPRLEDEGGVLMGGCTCNHRDENDQPSDLEVKEREFVESWDDLVSKQNHCSREGIQNLIDDESLPGLEGDVGVVQRIQSLD